MGRRGAKKPVTMGMARPTATSAGNGPAKKKREQKSKTIKLDEKNPDTNESTEETSSTSGSAPGEHARLIAQYHALNKYRESLDHDPTLNPATRITKRRKLDAEMTKLGGLEAYQQASLTGETAPEHKQFNAGQWVVQELRAEGLDKIATRESKLRLLDVGAIKNQYLDYKSWLDITAIDLNPQHPSVEKADFFQYKSAEPFDIVVMSLVINFVGDPRRKGEMLKRCKSLVKDEGSLFIVLPVACIENSRYMTHERFVKMLQSLGFALSKHKNSTKLCFYIFKKLSHQERSQDPKCRPREFKRKLCRGGLTRNNFCIIIKGPPKIRKSTGTDYDEGSLFAQAPQDDDNEEEEQEQEQSEQKKRSKKPAAMTGKKRKESGRLTSAGQSKKLGSGERKPAKKRKTTR